MSLYKRPGSQYWWIQFTTPGGQTVRRSSKTADKKAAEGLEARWKDETWNVDQKGAKPRRSWEEAVIRYDEEKSDKRSYADDLTILNWLSPHLQGKYLDEIDQALIANLASARRKDTVVRAAETRNVKITTVNRTLSVVRGILRLAVEEWGWLDARPKVTLNRKAEEKRVRWLKRDEADRLIAELPPVLASMARFTLATGLRARNVRELTWGQVDLEHRRLWCDGMVVKNQEPLGIPLSNDAVLVLREQQGKHPHLVFPTRLDGYYKDTYTNGWKAALKRSGIQNFRWHDLRHTWASWHVQSGTPIQVLKELGGWKTLDMVQRYAHLAPDHLAQYAKNVDRKLAPVPAQNQHSTEDQLSKVA